MQQVRVYSSFVMGAVFAGLGIFLLVKYGSENPVGYLDASGHLLGGFLIVYGIIRLVRGYFLYKQAPKPEED